MAMLARKEDRLSLWPLLGLFHLLLFAGNKDYGTKISFDQSSHRRWDCSKALPSFSPWPFPGPSFWCYCQLVFANSITSAFSCFVSTSTMPGLLEGVDAGQSGASCGPSFHCIQGPFFILNCWSYPSPPEAGFLFQQCYILMPRV